MKTSLIDLRDASFRKYQYQVFAHTSWTLGVGQHWAIVGANGSGKTTFLEILAGKLLAISGETHYHIPREAVASVCFSDSRIQYGNFYYQQRYHATETDGITTVRQFLGLSPGADLSRWEPLRLQSLIDMEIIKLSNGQFKKMLIVKALLQNPRLLLLDNLFTGLDAAARDYISDTLTGIADMGAQIVMTADMNPLPPFITHLMEVEHFSIKRCCCPAEATSVMATVPRVPPLPPLPEAPPSDFAVAVHLQKVNICCDGKTLLHNVDWRIMRGEKWALLGHNGAGKSLLLSLVYADHPQAYSNSLILFDRLRGTGESIWDIKERIGFVSPEMHIYSHVEASCMDYALEGLHGNPYARRAVTADDRRMASGLFQWMGITDIADTAFQRASTGQQNLVLLIRALLKNPPLLILDEPFQGLDETKLALARALLDAFCRERTLIFVSHRPPELPSCIERYMFACEGKVEERPCPTA